MLFFQKEDLLQRGSQEAYRQGIEAVVQEWKLYVRDWGFQLEDIDTNITLWYGNQDKMTPEYRGRYLDKTLPHSPQPQLHQQTQSQPKQHSASAFIACYGIIT